MSDITTCEQVAEGYLSALVDGDDAQLLKLVGREVTIEDPRFPGLSGEDGVSDLVSGFQNFFTPLGPRVEHLRTTVAERRVLCEDFLHIDHDGQHWGLPVGTVVAPDPTTGGVRIHVYYTNWPFGRKHSFRASLFDAPEEGGVEFTGAIQTYFESLLTGDIARIRTAWEGDIYFREASGLPYVHWGKDAVINYFEGLFSDGAPMLRDNTIKEGGRTMFMEFTVVGWDGQEWPVDRHEAGLAVYERVTPKGLMSAIRIYDDVDFS